MKAGTIEKLHLMDAETIADKGESIRFWLTPFSYVECRIEDEALNVRGMSDRASGAMSVLPNARNSVDVRVL